METATLINSVSKNSEEVIIIDSDEEDFDDNSFNETITGVKLLASNDNLEEAGTSILIFAPDDDSNEADVGGGSNNSKILMPKIVAVTGGVHVIHNNEVDAHNELIMNSSVSDDDSAYEDVVTIKNKRNKKKVRFPKNIHIKNRIKRIIKKSIRKNLKLHTFIKSYFKLLPKTKKYHHSIIKRNIRKYNSALPVKTKTNDNRWTSLNRARISHKNYNEVVRSEIIEQLKIFREKCINKPNNPESETVLHENILLEKRSLEKPIAKENIQQITSEDIVDEHLEMPCCSKSLCDTPVPDEVISESSEVVADCSVKSLDKTKYKSLKYRMLKNCKDKQILLGSDSSITPVITDKMETDFPIKSKDLSSNTIRSLYKDNESRVTDFAECDKTEAPRLDDIIERIRSLRPKKISEKDDILAVLKSGNEAFKQDISPTEEENVSQILPTSLDSARVGKESRMGASIAAGSVKIALPNGKIVKPKTLAEKRRLLRREFESDMRSKMQVNDQLLERQILRQKSNNRRPEYYDVRDKLLYDNAPMTRLSWIRATELPSANITFRQQYMMIDGRYVRICGSRGGSKRFLSPPPSSSDILEKKPAKIKQRLNSDQQSQFLPGPLCKKHLLIRKIPEMNNLYIRKKLPPIFLEVFPQFERPLEKIAESYLKIAFSNIVDNERARFASSALYNFENKEKFAFPLKYSDEQKEILCCLKEPIALPIEKSEVKLESLSDDSEIINDMLSDMFRCVETSLLDDSIIKLDPDAEAISKLPEIVSKSTLPESVSPERNTINYARKTALELRRLNVTVIEATECAANIAACCKEAYCHLGCVCSSLKCLTYSKRHCGNVECMFECTCEYTYRLRQKRSISQNNTSSIDEDDMLELKDRVCSGLAPVEAEFKHAVVVNQDHSVTLVDGETEKRKRSVKVPKRFNDYISSETMLPQPLSPIKHNEEIYEPRKINRTPIIPKEKLLLPRNLEVRLYNLKLEDVEPWCMVHELYKCFCDCMDAFGEPFGEGKCDNSLDQSDQNDDSTQNGHSIKTLNRTILLDTDEKNPLDKKNWHVELFSSDVEQETSSTVVEPVKRKIGPVISKYKDVSKKDSSVMRRKSNESLKRTRSSGNEEEKETVSKQPRIQIKSPWDLNQMVEQISGNKKDDEGSLLDEFALSTTSVVTEDAKFNKPPINGKNGVQAFVRQQLDDVKRSMRCARINQPYLPRNNRKDRTKRETQKRLAEIAAENANPTLLKRLQLLVKRSQISSMQRGLKLTSITNDMNDNKEQIELQPVKQMSLLGPPPLKPAPGARLLQKNVTNSDSQVLSITTKKESKTVNSVVNREILRMLNQKGALDAYFDISKPWMYHFQCLQWYKMLTSYKNNRINLWLEKNPAQHGTMALLTTSKNPPVPNCINMKTLEPAIAKRNVIDIPKFAIKIYSDCQKIHDPKHELQYVFMRAFPTHWTLEGVIEKGYKSKKENILDSNSALEIRNKKDDLEIKSFDETKKNSSSDIKTDIIQSSDKRKSLPNFVKKRIHTGKQNAVVKKRRLTQESQCNKSNSSSESDIKTDITKNIESKNASNSEPVIDKISNSANTSDIIASNDSSLENTSKMEELPFLIGMRYLFVSMKEKFSLLTSIRNGYRVTYNQLENAIETANSRKVYVRLKFKQNDLNSDQRGTVFAVPWCNDGVFIGPYGLSEQCMITKQIYWRNRILALTDYVRAVQNKDPKPVGYWMCYYGDDKKFIISYKNLAKRIDCLENNPNDSKLDDTSAEPIKVTSPNSLLKTNLSRKNSPPMLINKALQPEQKLITTPKLIKEDVISKIQCLNKEKVLSSENSAMTFLQRLSPAVEKGNNKSLLLNGNKQTPPIKITKVSSLNIGNLSNSQNHIPQKKADSSKLDTSINNAISKLSFMKNPLTKNVNNDFFQTLLKNGKLECNVNKSNDTSLDKNNEDSDDEPELIINEAENEVIDLLSDSEDDSIDLGAPGKRWLYCDVNGIGYVEAQVLKDKKISLRLPFSASTSEFKNFPDATSFINTNLRKIIYFLPNSFVPTWTITTSYNVVQNMKKMNAVLLQGNFVIYSHMLIDLSDPKNIHDHIKNKTDHDIAMKYAEHFTSRHIKHALRLKNSSQLSREQLAEAAFTEIRTLQNTEAKLNAYKKVLANKKVELTTKIKNLTKQEIKKDASNKIIKQFNTKPQKKNLMSADLIVIDDE